MSKNTKTKIETIETRSRFEDELWRKFIGENAPFERPILTFFDGAGQLFGGGLREVELQSPGLQEPDGRVGDHAGYLGSLVGGGGGLGAGELAAELVLGGQGAGIALLLSLFRVLGQRDAGEHLQVAHAGGPFQRGGRLDGHARRGVGFSGAFGGYAHHHGVVTVVGTGGTRRGTVVDDVVLSAGHDGSVQTERQHGQNGATRETHRGG